MFRKYHFDYEFSLILFHFITLEMIENRTTSCHPCLSECELVMRGCYVVITV